MSRRQPEPGTQMSAGASATLALGAPWRDHLVCHACGQRPQPLAPLEAVADVRVLGRRGASLVRSATEAVAQVSAALGATNENLRELLGEEIAEPVPMLLEAEPALQAQAGVLALLAGTVGLLVATIEGATVQDWERPRPHTDATAAEMVWLALHDAKHRLQDAEAVLDAALARTPGAWANADEQPSEVQFRHG